ncbi:MAG: heme-binding protein [Chloroflexi bacterium]|nr:heme-binding protein [Chloroflexota bacterium]
MSGKPFIDFEQAQAAMKAIIEEATKPGGMPVAISIVDDAGNMVAYAQMDHVRLYARRHAFRKAYTAAIMGMDTGAHGEQLKERGRTVSDYGDPSLTPGEGGVVVKSREGIIMGGIGVGGYLIRDEELAQIGLEAMNIQD